MTVTESANAPGAMFCGHAVRPLPAYGREDPRAVPGIAYAPAARPPLAGRAEFGNSAEPGESVAEPAVFSVVTVTLGASSALRLTLYGVGLVQVTEAGDAAFILAAVLAP